MPPKVCFLHPSGEPGNMATRGVTSGHYSYFYLVRAVCSSPWSTGVHSVLCGDVGVAATDEY